MYHIDSHIAPYRPAVRLRNWACWLLAVGLSFALTACGQGQLSEQDRKILSQLRHNGVAFDDKAAKREHDALVIDQVTITGSDGSTVHARRMLIRQYDTAHPNPYFADATMEGIVVPLLDVPVPGVNAQQSPETVNSQMGLPAAFLATNPAFADVLENGSLPLDATLRYRYDEKSRRFLLDDFSLRSAKLFGLQLQIAMSDLDPIFFQQNKNMGLLKPTTLLSQAAANSRLDSASLTYTDHSLVDRVLRLLGEQQHTTPQVIRDSFKGALGLAMMSNQSRGGAFMGNALMAISSFLEHPGTLRLAARPSEPVRMSALQAQGEQWKDDPAALMQALGVTLEALPPSSS